MAVSKERKQPIVCVDDITAYGDANTDRAIIRPHRRRETTLRPAKRMIVQVEERVLLLDAKPGLVRCCCLQYRCTVHTMVVNLGSIM